MYRIVVLVLCYHALSQPVSEQPSTRLARELIECCPCPGVRDVQEWVGDVGGGQLARSGLDECPCKGRDADSEGASSLLFPAALRPDGHHVRPSDPKEDPKNLLEPEVALATSVLDTLREVTEAEYRDALEREAAKNAAESDTVSEESARNVVIVVNPKDSESDDDFISEASHVQESRCIHPLKGTSLSGMRSSTNPTSILPGSFKLPNLKHLELSRRNLADLDSNIGASDGQESIVDTNGNVLNFSPKTTDVKTLKSILDNDSLRISNPNLNLGKSNVDDAIEGFKLSLIPKLKSRTDIVDDLSSAPSNVQRQSESTDKTSQLFENDKLPLNLRNLLKLRDVELIPKTMRNKSWAKPKLDLSKFGISTLFKTNQNKHCGGREDYPSNKVFSLSNKDSEQRENGGVNNNRLKNTEELQNTKLNTMHELEKAASLSHENISEDDESDAINDEKNNLDTLSSPSQIQSSVIRISNEKNLEANVLPKYISDCKSSESKESDINSEFKKNLDESHTMNSDSTEFENAKLATEDVINNDDIHDQDTDQDSGSNSSNTILSVLSPLETEEKTMSELEVSQKDFNFLENFNTVPERFADTLNEKNMGSKIPSINNTLSSLQENVVLQVEHFKTPSVKSELNEMLIDNDDNVNIDNEERDTNGDINQMATNLDPSNTADVEPIENVSDISMNDLQNMSNQLLDSNTNTQSNNNILDVTASIEGKETNVESSEINDKSDSKFSETKSNTIDLDSDIIVKENTCSTNLEPKNANIDKENANESIIQNTQLKEMDTGASDTIINTLPGILNSRNPKFRNSPLLSDMVLQPSSDPLNLLGKPLGDVLGLNTNLPTLDDLRQRLADVFNTDAGSLENDSSSSIEADLTHYSPQKTMATEASTRNSQKELPLLKQLEDFNKGLVKNKPSKLTPFDLQTKSRMLDLNSYRAHLPSPNVLDLKPLNLEPTFRNGAGKNKPSFKLGSDRTALRKTKPSSTLSSPLDSIPTLEELTDTLRFNTKNLLNSPVHSDLNLLSEKLRSPEIEDVAKNIRLNTERTFKGMQRKMKSSFKKPNLHKSLGDSLAKPQELLEDMNDRLKGIHYDLNDRLSSFRENILDSSRIKSFIDEPRKASNRNVMTNLRKPKTKLSPRLQTAASTTVTQETDPQSLGLEPRNYITSDWERSKKTQTAAQSAPPTPTKVEMPKSSNPPFSYLHGTSPSFRQNPIAKEFLREKTPTSSFNRDLTHFKDIKGPLIRTAVSPFNNQRQQNKVTITFGTTTARPTLPPRPNMSASQFERFNPSSTSSAMGDFNIDNVAANSKAQTGKFKPLRTSAPVPSPFDEDFEDTLSNFSNERHSAADTKLKSSVLREMLSPDPLRIHSNSNKLKSANIFDDKIRNHGSNYAVTKSHWPNVAENVLLSKVRDTNMKKLGNLSVSNERTEQHDMLRSPTENTDIVLNEPLKENVSYRCKMVCTKEIK